MLDVGKLFGALFLILSLQGCKSATISPTVFTSECVYYTEDLVEYQKNPEGYTKKHQGASIPLDKTCDYLTEETARQILNTHKI
jgi:hypothetical protein